MLNDTYRTELCLLYPPHLIAIASIYLSASLVTRAPPGGRSSTARTDGGSSTARTDGGTTPGAAPETPASNPLSRATQPAAAAPSAVTDATTDKNAGRGKTDLVTFLASLDVQLPIVLEIMQEIMSLYACWKAFDEPPNTPGGQGVTGTSTAAAAMSGMGMQNRLNGNVPIGPGDEKTVKLLARMRQARDVDLAHPANAGQP